MEFPTINFAYFALVALTVSWLLSQQRTVQKTFLLLASYFFAWKFHPMFLAVLIASSVMNWAFGKALVALASHPHRKKVLTLGLLANLGILGFYKYYGFFVDNLEAFLGFVGLEAHLPIFEVIAPFGISFYTFQGIAYLVDTHRGKAVQPASLLDFLLFIAFFPQFGAGPICRSTDLLPQIMAPARRHIPELSSAITMISSGLFKKMVLATFISANLTGEAFNNPTEFSSLELVLATYAYTAQVYLDFSGYTDLARGIGLLFGFKIPENFNYPYAATDIGDFWRRWHITFSTWLREYIYFPLGGSRAGRLRCYFNLTVTFVACGIWHGASWGYIIWGSLHAIGMTVYKASLDLRRDYGIKTSGFPFWWLAMGWFATLSFCAFVRIFFKCPDLTTAMQFWGQLFDFSVLGAGFDLGVLFVTLLTLFMNFFGRRMFNAFVAWHEQMPTFARPFAWTGILLVLLTLKPYAMAATIYFSF